MDDLESKIKSFDDERNELFVKGVKETNVLRFEIKEDLSSESD